MTRAQELVADYEAPAHVKLKLQVVDHTTATFDLAVHKRHRRSGLGTLAMEDLILMADELGVELQIYADPICMPLASIVRWYSQFGFEPVGKVYYGMQRMHRTVDRM